MADCGRVASKIEHQQRKYYKVKVTIQGWGQKQCYLLIPGNLDLLHSTKLGKKRPQLFLVKTVREMANIHNTTLKRFIFYSL
jgi:hypothetical protein